MINITDKQRCCGCHACYNSCPQKCISMQSDVEGFWYPLVDLERCTNCGLCEKVCPILCSNMVDNDPIAYACMNKDDEIRKESSSGGVFTVIAENVIANHGVVFGAGFDGEYNVVHSWTDSLEGISKFRGSKYVQSCIGETYKQTLDFLKQGRQVLFSGTPCQVGGLKSYLGEEYEALICVDIVCHGVPSPLVWEKYRNKVANGKEIKAISFRDKTLGWKKYSVSFEFSKGESLKERGSENLFIRGFLEDFYLRPSCYKCSFKSVNRQSDITLADFWGIKNVLPSFDDDRGTSLILVNSSKGTAIFSVLADKINCEKVDMDQALLYNPSAIRSTKYNPKRAKFLKELGKADISQLIAKYTKVGFSRKLYGNGRRLLSRIRRTVFQINSRY